MRLHVDGATQSLLDLLRAPGVKVHFSQNGEDCAVWRYFEATQNGFYVDVGCHEPFRYSNTYLLNKYRSWSGINIDADQRSIAKFREARPKDVNLCIGVGSVEEVRSFTVFKDGAVNTFDSKMAKQQAGHFGAGEIKEISVRRLENILNENLPPNTAIDYMNVDCEGLDHDVIISNDWTRFRPKVLSVELHGLNLEAPLQNPTVQFLKDQGYFMRANYFATAFFERRT